VLVLGCGVLWAVLTVIELSVVLPILRAGQVPASGQTAANTSTIINSSSDARNA
jgi:hypothetical protein